MSDSEYVICGYCGADYLWPEEVNKDGKCKACIVNDCSHKNIDREYEGSTYYRARWTIHCIDCGVYRTMRFYFPQTKDNNGYSMTLEDWDHDEVSKGDIYQ